MGKYYTISDTAKQYAAQSSLGAEKLHSVSVGKNYHNMLDILATRYHAGTATQEDLKVAEQLNRNIAKMSYARRTSLERKTGITYESLKQQANELYTMLGTADLADDATPAELQEQRDAIASKARSKRAARETVYASQTQTIDEKVASAPVAKKTGFGAYVRNLSRVAAAGTLLALLSCTGDDGVIIGSTNPVPAYAVESKPAYAPTYSSRKEYVPSGDVIVGSTNPVEVSVAPYVPVAAPKVEAPQEIVRTVAPAPKIETPKAPVPAPKPAPAPETKLAPAAKPAAMPRAPSLADDSFLDDFRVIAKGEVFGARDFTRETFTGKMLYNTGHNTGVDLLGQATMQTQKFDNGSLDGDIMRVGPGVFHYFEGGNNDAVYARLGAFYEDRDFTFTPDVGAKMQFGNTAVNGVAQLGYVKKGDFVDESLFDDSQTKALGTVAYGVGDMTGDIDGEYRSIRATIEGQQFLADTALGQLFLRGGVAYQHETLGKDWTNTIYSGELGPGLIGRHVRAAAAVTYRKLVSDFEGVQNTDNHVGGKVSLGWRPTNWLELGADGGYEGGKDGLGGNGMFSATLYLGKKQK